MKIIVNYSIKPTTHVWDLLGPEKTEHTERKDVIEIDLDVVNRRKVQRGKALTYNTLLDVRVAEELRKHPELIPESWRGTCTYFTGTTFYTYADPPIQGSEVGKTYKAYYWFYVSRDGEIIHSGFSP